MVSTKKLLYKILQTLGYNYIVEQGASDGWSYRKWSDGTAECWGYKLTTGSFTAWGQGYSHDIAGENYPSGLFSAIPYCFVSSRCTTQNTVSGANANGGSQTQATGVTHYRATSSSGSLNFQTFYYAIGKWN